MNKTTKACYPDLFPLYARQKRKEKRKGGEEERKRNQEISN
jgi:hypothetical protein